MAPSTSGIKKGEFVWSVEFFSQSFLCWPLRSQILLWQLSIQLLAVPFLLMHSTEMATSLPTLSLTIGPMAILVWLQDTQTRLCCTPAKMKKLGRGRQGNKNPSMFLSISSSKMRCNIIFLLQFKVAWHYDILPPVLLLYCTIGVGTTAPHSAPNQDIKRGRSSRTRLGMVFMKWT